MGRWADWFPISPDEARAFVSAKKSGAEAVETLLQPWLEKLEEIPVHVQMDKAWEPIHRCLTGNRGRDLMFTYGPTPLKFAVLGGRQILRHGYRSASLVDPDKVPRVAKALAKIDRTWMRERFLSLPDKQFHEINEEMFEWMWEYFEMLPPFFAKAASEGNAVICTISH
jgi:hypothetical protein